MFVRENSNGTCEFNVEPIAGYDIRKEVFNMASLNNFAIYKMASNELSLEDIFLRLTDESFNTEAIERSLNAKKEKEENE